MMRGLHRKIGPIQSLEAEGETDQCLSMEQTATKRDNSGEFKRTICRIYIKTVYMKKFGLYSVGNRRHTIRSVL